MIYLNVGWALAQQLLCRIVVGCWGKAQPTIVLSISLFTPIAYASDAIMFKPEFVPKHGWLQYGVAILMLLVMSLLIAKKYKPRVLPHARCQLIEKKYLGNKTMVYIIEYQQQRFLLADNQNALAVHLLKNEDCNDSV